MEKTLQYSLFLGWSENNPNTRLLMDISRLQCRTLLHRLRSILNTYYYAKVRPPAAIQKNMWHKSNFHFVQGCTKNNYKHSRHNLLR